MLNYLNNSQFLIHLLKQQHNQLWSMLYALMMLILAQISYAAPAILPEAQEYQVKAVFLYNFANFVQWPTNTFQTQDTPFYICIYGQDPFAHFIDLTVENETVQNRIILVKRSQELSNLLNCQILFISNSEQENVDKVLNFIAGKPILTVSDLPRFAEQGGMIEFFFKNKHIRLLINLGITRENNLSISANLLRVSQVINE